MGIKGGTSEVYTYKKEKGVQKVSDLIFPNFIAPLSVINDWFLKWITLMSENGQIVFSVELTKETQEFDEIA